jgi:hypothetical protein
MGSSILSGVTLRSESTSSMTEYSFRSRFTISCCKRKNSVVEPEQHHIFGSGTGAAKRCVSVFCPCVQNRVETEITFFIFAKGKNKRKFATKFSFSQKFSRKILVFANIFAKNFRFCENSFFAHVSDLHVYTFSWLLDPDPHSEWKIFAKTFAKLKIFAKILLRLSFQTITLYDALHSRCYTCDYRRSPP